MSNPVLLTPRLTVSPIYCPEHGRNEHLVYIDRQNPHSGEYERSTFIREHLSPEMLQQFYRGCAQKKAEDFAQIHRLVARMESLTAELHQTIAKGLPPAHLINPKDYPTEAELAERALHSPLGDCMQTCRSAIAAFFISIWDSITSFFAALFCSEQAR